VTRPLLLATALVGAWQLYADLGPVGPLLLPSPADVGGALIDDAGLLASNLEVTAAEVGLGIALSTAAALALATLIHLSAAARRAIYPLLIGSQTIPVVIVAPLLATWLGYGLGPKLVVIALICFFPIVVTTLDGLAGVDPELRKLMRSLDAGRLRTLALVEAPGALPSLFSGLRIAVVVSMIGAVFAEQAGSSDGLGHLIQQAIAQLQTARAWAAVVLLSAFAFALFQALVIAERRLLPWTQASAPA
jgi:ABC-type nitrate/sulfonate/bicarbonate transport system permease component